MTRLAALLACATLLGCGARSVLELGDASTSSSTGTGGNGGTDASTGAGGIGGTGGSIALSCEALQVGLGPTYLPWADPFFHTSRPDLVGLEDDSVAWVTSLVPVESPGFPPIGVGHASLRPWSGSNLIASEPQLVSFAGGRSVASTETGRVGLYALAIDPYESPSPGNQPMRVLRTVDPEVDYGPIPDGVDVPAGPSSPELLVEMDDGLLYGWEIPPSGGNVYLGLARIGDEVELATSASSACASYDLEVRAVATPGGAIMATASGREPDACLNDDGIPGPPRYLQTGFVDGEDLSFDVAQSEQFSEPIHFLDLVGGGDHAWTIWQTDGSTSLTSPPVRAVRLDPSGTATAPSVEVIPSGYFPPYGVAALGDGFVFAHLDLIDPGPPTMVVVVFDANGQRIGEGSATLDFAGFGERLAVIASPDQDAVLVGFAAQGIQPDAADPTGILRFDCAR